MNQTVCEIFVLYYINVLSSTDIIFLKYQKTLSTHTRCTIPNCRTPTDRLRLISYRTRFKAMKTKELCIPAGARACYQHFNDNAMLSDVQAVNSSYKFNRKQIEDIINLLNGPKLNSTLNVPGNFILFHYIL